MSSRIPAVVAALALALALVVVASIAFVIIRSGGPASSHTLRASFDDVNQLVAGQQVRVAGRKVGEIKSIRLVAGKPQVEMTVTDGHVWPLPRGTYAQARYGSTTSYLLRYVELIPGPRKAPPLAEDGLLPEVKNQNAFELDQSYRIFRGDTRKQVGGALDGRGQARGSRGDRIKAAVAAGGPGLGKTATFLGDLGADQQALRTLAVLGNRATGALAARDGQIRDLVTHAGNTFETLASRATAQQHSLDRLPEGLDQSKQTFARLDGSLDGLTQLVDDLRPGTGPLRSLAHTLRTTLHELRIVAPLAAQTLGTGARAAPAINGFVGRTTPFFPRAGRALSTFDPMLGCIRPYGPEIAGFLVTWSGFTHYYDSVGHFARSFPLKLFGGLYPGTKASSADALQAEPQLRYAFPRPPGLNAGSPWYLPGCGVGRDSTNVHKDPEGQGR